MVNLSRVTRRGLLFVPPFRDFSRSSFRAENKIPRENPRENPRVNGALPTENEPAINVTIQRNDLDHRSLSFKFLPIIAYLRVTKALVACHPTCKSISAADATDAHLHFGISLPRDRADPNNVSYDV